MTFWAYMLHCRAGYFYTGQTDNLEKQMSEHEAGVVAGFASAHRPLKLVWSAPFASRIEALEAEKRIKGWSRSKKMALIRGDWAAISALAKSKNSPSTSSGRTGSNVENSIPLTCHAETVCHATSSVSASVIRGKGLTLRYVLTGDISNIVVPAPVVPVRTDGLWQTTCFEAFIAPVGAPVYAEYNASPSGAWAAYHFAGYRDGMIDLAVANRPEIGLDASDSHFALEVDYDVPPAWATLPLRLGLSAVIEEQDGTKSYWALAHPPGKPDFHHGDCFVLHLAAPEQP